MTSCMCAVVTYRAVWPRPENIVIDSVGNEYCTECFKITAEGQDQVCGFINSLGED